MWKKQWRVPGQSGKTYVVSQKHDGSFACSCPQWIYRRDDCKHIKAVRILEAMGVNASTKLTVQEHLPLQTGRKFNFDE